LQDAFYPYFKDFFVVLVDLLDTYGVREQDTDLLEDIFTTLCYFFKFLQKQIVPDMKNVFALYAELLHHRKDYIKNFAAESFAFLLRKVPQKQLLDLLEFVTNFTKEMEDQEGFQDGKSLLFFQVMKVVNQRQDNLFRGFRSNCILKQDRFLGHYWIAWYEPQQVIEKILPRSLGKL